MSARGDRRGHDLDRVEQSHESEIHVMLHVTVEKAHARLIGKALGDCRVEGDLLVVIAVGRR